MNMDRIKRIIQIGTVENDQWTTDGDVLVFFEDESKTPVRVPSEDGYQVYEEYARQNNLTGDLDEIIVSMDDEALGIADKNNQEELDAAMAEFENARRRAEELQRQRGGEGVGAIPIPTPIPTGPVTGNGSGDNNGDGNDGNNASDTDEEEEEEDYGENLETPIVARRNLGKKVVGGILAAAAALGAGYTISQMVTNQTEKTQDVDDDQDKDQDMTIDFDTATFSELMDSMEDDDARKIVAQDAMELVQTFHNETHKDGNFRLVEDQETYLDLSYEEAVVLSTFANYNTPEDLYQILGTYDITSETAQDLLESARAKLTTYYMNAVEPSGLAELFHSEEDRAFFQNFESEVIAFNVEHSTAASDQVIRDVYYNYILDGATNATNVNPMAKLLAFDTVNGGLNLVESASTEHTQFLQFHGMGEEEETKYYIENVKHLDYSSMSEEQRAGYREEIIESNTALLDLLSTGEVMNEDNSTQEERDASWSITELVDRMGLCNEVNDEITEKIQSLKTASANDSAVNQVQIANINQNVYNSLVETGEDDLANRVLAANGSVLSDELLGEIRAANSDAAKSVENYEKSVSVVNDENRPTMQQIVNAAHRYTALLDHYAGDSKDIAMLINNRRHTEIMHVAGENGYLGTDEDGIPIYDASVLDGMTDEEIDDFIIENGEVIDEHTDETTEEVDYDDLTPEEKEEVDEQKNIQEAQLSKDNASAQGQIAANANANSNFYAFSNGVVTNDLNGETYDLNSMTFVNGVAYAYAFNGAVPTTGDSQIQNAAEVAAENYLNGISAEQQEAIANGMGTDWASARAQLKQCFKDGYFAQMENEISTAIATGEDMKRANDEMRKEIEELNKQEEEKQQEEQQDDQQEQPSEDENQNEDENQDDQQQTQDDEYGDVEQGETEPTAPSEENQNETGQGEDTPAPAPDESTDDSTQNDTTDPSDEEYDDNIGEHFEDGEVLIEDASGNDLREDEEISEPGPVEPVEDVQEETQPAAAPVEEAAPVAEEVQVTEPVKVEEAPQTQEETQPAAAPVEEQKSEEEALNDAVAQAYEEYLAQQEAAAENETESIKTM